jgi:pimeloyl-ACP methyl ester carboxylesterase
VSTYALVHGAWHGGWCWSLLAPELEARGHDVVAPDLPSDDPEASIEDYARAVLDALDARGANGGDLVVVGHSLGGLTAPVVAARRPVRKLVMLCAVVPEPGKALSEQYRDDPMEVPEEFFGRAVTREDKTSVLPPEAAERWLYHDCEPAVAREAAAHMRPQGWKALADPSPLSAWPDVPSSYVLCTGDRVVQPEWSRRVAKRVMGVEALELPGSHSPMLSRPAALAELIG